MELNNQEKSAYFNILDIYECDLVSLLHWNIAVITYPQCNFRYDSICGLYIDATIQMNTSMDRDTIGDQPQKDD